MATNMNMTEEEPMLAVVCSTVQQAWADAGPEVADPEVARLYAEAQQHVLAARWLDMAALMLASADLLLLLSPRVPDKELECFLTDICNLITKAGSEEEALEIELFEKTQPHGRTRQVFFFDPDGRKRMRVEAGEWSSQIVQRPSGGEKSMCGSIITIWTRSWCAIWGSKVATHKSDKQLQMKAPR